MNRKRCETCDNRGWRERLVTAPEPVGRWADPISSSAAVERVRVACDCPAGEEWAALNGPPSCPACGGSGIRAKMTHVAIVPPTEAQRAARVSPGIELGVTREFCTCPAGERLRDQAQSERGHYDA